MADTYFIKLLASAINNTVPEYPPADIDWNKIYMTADKNGVAPTLYYALIKLPKEERPGADIVSLFEKKMHIALGIESMQHIEVSDLLNKLEDHGIEHVPLKGWIIKNYYPYPHMRTMCDVDILVRKSDMPEVAAILAECGFVLELHGHHHDGYVKSGNIAVEIHWNLFAEDSDYYDYFKDIFERLEPVEKKIYQKRLSHEDFYLHMIAHLAKHFDNCGTGIRSFADIWLYCNAMGDVPDAEYIDKVLRHLGLKRFDDIAKKAASDWFSDKGCMNEEYLKIANHILYFGTYGIQEIGIMSGVNKKGGKKWRYLMRRFFPGRQFLIPEFPALEKNALLLPVCWMIRGMHRILFRRDKISSEIKALGNVDDESIQAINDMKKYMGLTDDKDGIDD